MVDQYLPCGFSTRQFYWIFHDINFDLDMFLLLMKSRI